MNVTRLLNFRKTWKERNAAMIWRRFEIWIKAIRNGRDKTD